MAEKFIYKARNLSGRMVAGSVEAENRGAAISLLRKRKFFVLEIKQKPEHALISDLKSFFKSGVGMKDLALFCRQFSTMSGSGIPLLQCMHILSRQTENGNLRKAVQLVAADLEKGQSMTESFRRFPKIFPDIFINIIAAGEISGAIDQVLERLAVYFDREFEMREKIKSAVTYPVTVVLISAGALIALMTFVLPAFTEILTDMNASLPLPTLLVIGASNFMRHWWYLLPAGAAVFICLAHRLIQTSKGKILADQTVLMTPVFGPLIRKIIISQFARTLGSLLQSGVPILHALQIVKNITDNSIIKKALIDAEDDLREGQGMAFSLEKSGIFPPMVTNMITIGEETGALDTLLEKIALFYERETETTITRLSKMLEPVLLVVIGAVVGFIIVSIMFPIFSILDAVE